MIKTQTVKVETQQTIDIICNSCGHTVKGQHGAFEYVDLDVSWGYGSKKDTEHHQSHICEDCYDEIVANFKIKPEIKSYY